MIKLELPEKPKELTIAFEKKAIQDFIDDKKNDVWNKPFIREAVRNITFGKCCYSESPLKTGSLMNIDHFYPKSIFPEKVVEWGNLLPSNSICNNKKSNHNPELEPIINPLIDNPKDFLFFENSFLKSKNPKGKLSIIKLSLNSNDFLEDRNEIEKITIFYLKTHTEKIKINKNLILKDEKSKLIFIEQIQNLFKTGTKEKKYSALVSTIILQSDEFKIIEQFLTENNFWDSEFDNLKKELEFCCLKKE